ncbi:DNA topoisomerase 2-binding protein 1-like isoform X2 [Limulus polyphemus]|uniref:DNA topoisomerase 2-binding protein 1-like isoform X2 n=1 Tax=Limulus polyphemus TaxID=6850 RepID=A0ABM1BNY8_LIMPO|nr:DNA topoisomerase 2-binding protein 1-like isoform X2 [Limulus polyphemus]
MLSKFIEKERTSKIINGTMQGNISVSSVRYEVCFVIPDGKKVADLPESMRLAFSSLEASGIDSVWTSTQACLEIKEKENKLYIFDPFIGVAFDHLVSLNCRIMGPLCILTCLEHGEALPKRPYPVYSLAFRKMTITCSNVDKQTRLDIEKKVQLMGGNFIKDLTKSVTHLVAGEVGSKKYHVAANFSLPVMLPNWVEECWEQGQHQRIHASDPCFNIYRCPVFKGLNITVSQIESDERKKIQKIIEDNGGSYSGALKAKETTHLVLVEPKGEKFKFAKTWKLYCVKVEWIYDSISAGYCLDETLYQLVSEAKQEQETSTPKKNSVYPNQQAVDCSTIANVSSTSRLDETAQSDITIITAKPNRNSSLLESLNNLNVKEIQKKGNFLDGCQIFLSGWSGQLLEKLQKIINAAGGMRFNKLSENVTHVIVGDHSEDHIRLLSENSVRPFVVRLEWLIHCCKEGKLVDENPYSCLDTVVSKFQPEAIQIGLEPTSFKEKDNMEQRISLEKNSAPTDFSDIMNQYLPSDKTMDEVCLPLAKEANVAYDKHLSVFNPQEEKADVDNEKQNDNEEESDAYIFDGLRITIVGFGLKDTELLAEMVETNGGILINDTNKITPDIAVLPLTGGKVDVFAKEIVTNCWLQMCLENEKLLSFNGNPLFRPIVVKPENSPLNNCVLSFSQYAGTERDCLMHLAEVLGGTCQEYFVRKANKSRGLLPNTHLVVQNPEGSKYEAAKKWNIPAVKKDWLLETAESGEKALEEDFLVDSESVNVEDKKLIQNMEKCNSEVLKKNDETKTEEQRTENLTAANQEKELKSKLDTKSKMHDQILSSEQVKNDTDQRKPATPLIINQRVKELMRDEKVTPQRKVSDGSSTGVCSPSNFLIPGVEYFPQYDVTDALNCLDSPGSQRTPAIENSRRRRSSLPLEDFFKHNLSVALKNFGANEQPIEAEPQNKIEKGDISEKNESFHSKNKRERPLAGVVLCVSKKLSSKQGELNKIIGLLGGDYCWTYDSKCTHFVYQGKSSDITRELKLAKEQGKHIVCPDWVYACRDENELVDESLFPYSFNPRMSLSGQVSTKKVHVNYSQSGTEKELSKTPVKDAKGFINSSSYEIFNEIKDGRQEVSGETQAEVSKQLEEIMSATKTAKAGKCLSRRLNSSNGSNSSVNQNFSDRSKIKPEQNVQHENAGSNGIIASEASQSVPITWDDPLSRQEREKIAEQLARNGKQTQETQSLSPTTNHEPELEVEITEPMNDKSLVSESDKSTTNVNVNISSSGSTSNTAKVSNSNIMKFMLSGLSEEERDDYSALIEELGGKVSDLKCVDKTATHLIMKQPLKNEKFLASVASGKWVLHKSYMEACRQAGKFVDEKDHEWGGKACHYLLAKMPEKMVKIALCPHRWRVKIQDECLKNPNLNAGAFKDWKVLVLADRQKTSTYSRILTIGGAEVVQAAPPYFNLQGVTHAFIDLPNNSLSKTDLENLASAGIHCVKPEFLAFSLIEDPSPPPSEWLIPEVMHFLQESTADKKRKSGETTAINTSKRTRKR